MMLFIHLVIAIAIILVCILKLKLNAAIALVLGSLYMGIACGLDLITTIDTVASGFGNLMTSLGLSIGFGVILGQLLSDSGGAKKIAHTMVNAVSPKYAMYALAGTAFILSVPVFFDVTFVILIPLGVAISRETNKPLHYAAGSIAIGAGAAHTFVPPTPNPLAAAEILSFDLGIMVGAGFVVGGISVFIALKLFYLIMDKGFWNKATDETGVGVYVESEQKEGKQPSFIASLFPVVLPVILILLGTVWGAVSESVPVFVSFLANKNTALLLGVIAAYAISTASMTKDDMDKSATEALKSAGIVLLITGAGGSFGAVIGATGLADFIAQSISSISTSPIIALLLAFVVAAVFRVALGSGTVASITTMTLMSSVAGAIDVHPVWIALACLSGALSIGHVNDSGFWVVANLSGFTIKGGLKTYTLGEGITAVFAIIFTIIGSFIF